MSAKNISFSVTFKTYDGQTIPMNHRLFESVNSAKKYAIENTSNGNYKSYIINENDEPELPLSGGSGPTAAQARKDTVRQGERQIGQQRLDAAKEKAEKRHPIGSRVTFDASFAHALGAGVDRYPGLRAFSKSGRTMTGTVVGHTNDIFNYKGNGKMNVGGTENPIFYPRVKLDKPIKVAGRTITHTTINPPYLKISDNVGEDNANMKDVSEDNFTNDDIHELISMPIDAAKQRAVELISTRSDKPMKPAKVAWFKNAIAKKRSTMDVVKLMYDLLLSGEGNSVIGTSTSTDKNSYRKTFSESKKVNEDISVDAVDMEKDHEVQMARSQLYHAARDAMRLHKMLKSVSEAQGLEGWVAAKITKAADYLDSVADYMEYELIGDRINSTIPDPMPMENQPINEAMRIDKVNIIYPESGAEKFARHYRAGMIGDYRPGGPTEQDETNSEKFWSMYDKKSTRSGFAGSGTATYTNKQTGESFIVDINPNGKGFYGNDHNIKVATSMNETAYEKDLDDNKPVVIRGVKGAKSKPFRKKFRNMAAYEKWSDTDDASDYEVHDVMNETTTAGGVAAVVQPMGKMRKRKK